MTSAPIRVLVVEDNPGDVDLIREELSDMPAGELVVESVDRLRAALLRLTSGDAVDVVLLDLGLPDSSGLQTLVEIRRWAPDVPVVVLTARAERAIALGALRAGAQDFLIKGERGELIRRSVLYAVERRRAEAGRIHLVAERAAREAAEDARRRSALLAEASALLSSPIEFERMWARFAELVVTRWADCCVVEVLGKDQEPCGLTVAHADPAKRELAEALWRSRSYDSDERSSVAEALRTRRSLLAPDVPDSFLVDASRDPESVELMRRLGPRSAILVPMVSRGEVVGLLALLSESRPYGPTDLALAEDLGRRAAIALDNVSLHFQAQKALGEAEEALRVRDEFLSIASHELKTPLSALVLHLESLLKVLRARPDEGESAWIAGKIAKAIRSAGRVSTLIDTLLDVSRIATGRLELSLETLDLGPLVREVAERFAEEAHLAGCALRVDAAAGVIGEWDRLRVEQVLSNLLSNAVKYGPGRPIDVALEADGAVARLSVRDRGIGISPEDVARVFERFERAVSARHFGGLGLGLYITRQIVEAHGGHVHVDSTPSEGSTFIVELPRHRAAAPTPAAEAGGHAPGP
ncbi:MAG: response regulator [Deltaproteobacteria bacterium]|nr:response regulator [Deltaproteobacteria bacterium]